MNYKLGSTGYARFTVSNKRLERRITAHVTVTRINGEYLELIDNDGIQYKIDKNKFHFVKEIV